MLTEKELFDRLVQLETDKLTVAEDIKQIKKDSQFDEDDNPQGIAKESLALVHAAAKLEAKQNFCEFKEKNEAVIAKYDELTA